jgi:hypothetical protein
MATTPGVEPTWPPPAASRRANREYQFDALTPRFTAASRADRWNRFWRAFAPHRGKYEFVKLNTVLMRGVNEEKSGRSSVQRRASASVRLISDASPHAMF